METDKPNLLSDRFEQALHLAAERHADQKRTGTEIPYISHVLAVTSMVLENGADEDEAIGALLHDLAEDRGGKHALMEIYCYFGQRVSEIVLGCTDTVAEPRPPWRERKEKHLIRLRNASPSVRLVAAADKLHNARSILADYREIGNQVWKRFSGGKEGVLWYYRELVDALSVHGSNHRLVKELDLVVSQLEDVVAIDLQKTVLCDQRGATSYLLWAMMKPNGDLEVAANDAGEAPQSFIGGDYEYWVTVPWQHHHRLLKALILKIYGGNISAVDDFREFLDANGIPNEFDTFFWLDR